MHKYFGLIFFFSIMAGSFYAAAQQLHYRNPADSAGDYYLRYMPEGEPIGMLLLLPGFGETPHLAAAETAIPLTAAKKGLICIIASLPQGPETFYIDPSSQHHLAVLIEELHQTYGLAGKKFYMGGFSLGGAAAVKYARDAGQSKHLKKPHAIFAIDPPLDLERFYHSLQKTLAAGYPEVAVQEALYIKARIHKELGISPAEDPKLYYRLSPFAASDPKQGAARELISQPILLVSEPALEWQQTNRGRAFEDLNAYDFQQLAEQLQTLGNSNAKLIFTKDKGFRKQQKAYHPHSWSIADPEESLQWLLKY